MEQRVTRPRQTALTILREIRRGELADRALDRIGQGLESRDYGWVQELVYGTLRLRGRIDHLLTGLVRGGLGGLEADVLDVLRLGAYQLLEMGSVPPYAAISQSVELARWAGAARASGLVNGVLQSLQRTRDRLEFPDASADPLAYLVAHGSHPEWLVQRWLARWGYEDTRALIEANNQRPELFIRIVRGDPAEAVAGLASAGVEAEPVRFSARSLRILPPASAGEVLEMGPAIVQDPAASLVVDYAAVPDGATVIDLCAAPGGKAVAMAGGAGYVTAADLSLGRLRRVRDNVYRVGAEGKVGVVVADGRTPPFRPADVVLLDAPCTGTGTLRRHPDGRWRVQPQDLAALVALQAELLESAAALVAPGGLLVYSTCSLEPEENEAQVAAFVDRHAEFTRDTRQGAVDDRLLNERGELTVLPQRMGVDGSFAARLRRSS